MQTGNETWGSAGQSVLEAVLTSLVWLGWVGVQQLVRAGLAHRVPFGWGKS